MRYAVGIGPRSVLLRETDARGHGYRLTATHRGGGGKLAASFDADGSDNPNPALGILKGWYVPLRSTPPHPLGGLLDLGAKLGRNDLYGRPTSFSFH